MIKLKNAIIKKYKSIESDQSFQIEPDVTVFVGMNESGKTSVLETLAKTNYFDADEQFRFNLTHDYPRMEKKLVEKAGENPIAVTIEYQIDSSLMEKIASKVGKDVLASSCFYISYSYNNEKSWEPLNVSIRSFWDFHLKNTSYPEDVINQLKKVENIDQLKKVQSDVKDNDQLSQFLKSFDIYFLNEPKWENALWEYITSEFLEPNLPKFLYYDEYYLLPSQISVEKLNGNKLVDEELKTAKALFELADINTKELVQSEDFEDYKAELEATQAIISRELFEYWTTNRNIEIQFDIQKIIETSHNHNGRTDRIVEHILHVRVKNKRTFVSLPLKNRSKGFNWFFSFLVWFKKIQEDKNSSYVLLLDEPGLNLHASAQEDLLRFVEDLSKQYQVIYTTHSPFMIDSQKLHRVRTVYESDKGTVISESIQEKDPKTLFPLQAALGYDIAQNLFVSKNNLLIEGVSDMIYLEVLSDLLKSANREGLRDDITLVPTGGLDKVATFISLLRGSKLNIACLLDSFIDAKGKARVDDLIAGKIIKQHSIKFFDEYCDLDKADIEDLFEKEEYLHLFNEAFKGQFAHLAVGDLNPAIKNILLQIRSKLGVQGFNHFKPANTLARKGVDQAYFSATTVTRFEKLFKSVNALFPNP